jgi:hypothetical protein
VRARGLAGVRHRPDEHVDPISSTDAVNDVEVRELEPVDLAAAIGVDLGGEVRDQAARSSTSSAGRLLGAKVSSA